jgi:putative ABC transport system permease protein
MFRFAPLILKSLWRHRARTLLTVSGSAAALFVFAFIESAQAGLAGLTRQHLAERTLIVFQANRYCPSSSRLPEDYSRTIAALPGVKEVVPVQVFLNNCRASLDVVLFHGLPPAKLRTARALRLLSGSWDAFEQQTDAAVVGQALARRRRLAPGQKFTLGDVTVTVVGVFSADTPAEENLLYAHLIFLQQSRGRNGLGLVTQHEVHLTEDASPEGVSREIDATFRNGPVATDTRTRGAFQASVIGDLAELIGWAGYLGYACVGLVLALVATTVMMAVQDRLQEYAVLQAIGFSDRRIFALVLAEGVLVSLAGGLLGIGLAAGWLLWHPPALATEGVTLALSASPEMLKHGLLAAIGVGLLASIGPAWQAARSDLVRALRAG